MHYADEIDGFGSMRTILHDAIGHNNLAFVVALLECGADPRKRMTPIGPDQTVFWGLELPPSGLDAFDLASHLLGMKFQWSDVKSARESVNAVLQSWRARHQIADLLAPTNRKDVPGCGAASQTNRALSKPAL